MNRQAFLSLFPNASESTIAANTDFAELPGDRAGDRKETDDAVRAELEPSHRPRNVGKGEAEKADPRRFLVRVTSVRRILLDEDNLCEKYLVDCCRYSGLLPGDRPGQTKIEVSQRKAEKGETERSIVEIFVVEPSGG